MVNYIIIVTKSEVHKRKWKQNIPSLLDIKKTYNSIIYVNNNIHIGTMTDTLEKVSW